MFLAKIEKLPNELKQIILEYVEYKTKHSLNKTYYYITYPFYKIPIINPRMAAYLQYIIERDHDFTLTTFINNTKYIHESFSYIYDLIEKYEEEYEIFNCSALKNQIYMSIIFSNNIY